MKKQISVDEFKPVTILGRRQNCYRLDRNLNLSETTTKNPNKEIEKYESLEKQILPNGYIEGIVLKDYPINSKSVSSLAEGADYRNDPATAIAQAPKRVNLGDMTEAQRFLEDPQNNARIYEHVKQVVAEYYASQQSKTAPIESQKQEKVDNEVNNG